ncbi:MULTISPECIES: DUF742 domain-containing protein [unclassified Streptosporangium]|uniref:DUF742 domain-containing protein n=1 Tax=unclassified Streptosporangium TaxID=2632669 RepID=UPI002E27FDE0|nr:MULTISPECIES: DUF742 domain-containing protein [unclassified Streptosporangium]
MTAEHPLDQEPGPIIRPYTVTRGRTRAAGAHFDLMAVVVTVSAPQRELQPEYLSILDACRTPIPVVELAARTALAVGVLRVLLGDLRDSGLINVRPPTRPSALPRESLLRDLLAGLRTL